jgi:hypothetical protein
VLRRREPRIEAATRPLEEFSRGARPLQMQDMAPTASTRYDPAVPRERAWLDSIRVAMLRRPTGTVSRWLLLACPEGFGGVEICKSEDEARWVVAIARPQEA